MDPADEPLHHATWLPSGRLSQLVTDFGGGVYLFIHDGSPRRIIYVGTAKQSSGFTPRWCKHLSLFACGGRTVWRPSEETDVYTLMKLAPEEQMRCCRDGLVWMPGSLTPTGFYSPLVEGATDYKDHWREWVLTEYLDKISVWRCRIEDDHLAQILESKIQLAFKSKFGISYYRSSGSQSWLGRVEVTDRARLSSVQFEFAALPDLEPASEQLLADLPINRIQ
jgi:hypothetical protein